MKRGIVYAILSIIVISIIAWGYIMCSRRIVVESKDDLKAIFGYDFSDSDIVSIYNKKVAKDYYCVCIILNDDLESFTNDEFIKNTGFSDEQNTQIYFNKFKEILGSEFDIVYEQTNNNGYSMKDYVFKSCCPNLYESYATCTIQWFSADLNGKEQIVIYAFVPAKIVVKGTQGDGSLVLSKN